MDKKNVQKRNSTKHFWEKTRGLYNKWAEGLKRTRDHCIFINAYKIAVIKSKKKQSPPLPAQGPNGADDGGSGGKRGHKRGGDGKNALDNRKNLLDGGNNLLLEEVLLLGFSGTEVHFICKRGKGSKGGLYHMQIL